MTKPSKDTLSRMIAVVGERNAITDAADMARYMKDWRNHYPGVSPLVVRPGSTEEVSRIVAIAHDTGTAIVPQSGNTGLVGGSTTSADGTQVLLSLDRMQRIIEVDATDYTITVEAGAILQNIQQAAEQADRLFPLSLAAQGMCRIGGNLSTNAGGLNVLAYGSARDLCLGLEVVLSDGRIWNGLRKLRKDNTGYDLRDIFIGSEGTLGIITAAVLKLFPRPRAYETAFVAVPSPQAAVDLLAITKDLSGNRAVAFELMPQICLDFTEKHTACRNPLATRSPWYVLTELADTPNGTFERIFEAAVERKLASDAVIAQSEAQRQAMWDIREQMPDTQRLEGGSIKGDISVPVSRIAQYIEEATRGVLDYMPAARVLAFGHMGDGNLHVNVSQPVGAIEEEFLGHWDAITAITHGVALKLQGSISAEHGMGRMKRDKMRAIKSPVEFEMMRNLKRLFDPKGILNPGKVLPE
jgi:FAD/FMN-containing dehydrogenase